MLVVGFGVKNGTRDEGPRDDGRDEGSALSYRRGSKRARILLWEILCSTDRVMGSAYIVRVSLIIDQAFFIRTSRYNKSESGRVQVVTGSGGQRLPATLCQPLQFKLTSTYHKIDLSLSLSHTHTLTHLLTLYIYASRETTPFELTMTSNRTHFRNVHIYDATKPTDPLGRLVQNGSATESNFLQMLGIILVTGSQPIRVQHRASGDTVSMSGNTLQLGIYDVYCGGAIRVSDEPWAQRIVSFNVPGRGDRFRAGIRARGGGCVVSGMVNTNAPYDWPSYEAAHIFPLEKENLWIECGFGQCITDMEDAVGVSKMNSCQNGLLLQASVQKGFYQYLFSVNPDVNLSSQAYFVIHAD